MACLPAATTGLGDTRYTLPTSKDTDRMLYPQNWQFQGEVKSLK